MKVIILTRKILFLCAIMTAAHDIYFAWQPDVHAFCVCLHAYLTMYKSELFIKHMHCPFTAEFR